MIYAELCNVLMSCSSGNGMHRGTLIPAWNSVTAVVVLVRALVCGLLDKILKNNTTLLGTVFNQIQML